MWLKKLVGISMIASLLGMNGLMIVGLLKPDKHEDALSPTSTNTIVGQKPTVTLSVDPGTVAVGSTGSIKWSTANNATACTASGSWSGDKTPFGTESTGRLSTLGDYTYKLTCSNKYGSANAEVKVVASASPAPTQQAATASSPPPPTSSYCGGRLPCYGPKEVAAHSGKGNCWGWNLDRVIDISGFDSAYHQAKSGISSIEVSGLCGKDLTASLSGSVSAEGQTRDHNSKTKSNADKNELPYFVGYFDGSKP